MTESRVVSGIGAFLLAAILASGAQAQGGEVLAGVPVQPNPTERYVIYLHARIIEELGPHPVDERFGTYEYQQILEALASRGANVIAEVRSRGTDFVGFGVRVADQVRELLEAGVPAAHIAVVGFSKGGAIAIIASARLANPDIRFVFLGACGDWLEEMDDVDVGGRILSIFERSDELGTTCKPLFERAQVPGVREELEIDTGLGHGAFYRPRAEWLAPVMHWIGGR